MPSLSNSQVLKLVHPGGFVELHTNPVTASQVMSRNPRHCVTRPDFFRFPWIVVSPDSILTPGHVFFIVPCRTIRHLLKNNNPTAATNHVEQGCHSRARKIPNSKKVQCFRNQQSSSSSVSCVKLRSTQKKKGGNKAQSSCVYSSEYSASKERGLRRIEQVPKPKPCLKKDNKSRNDAGSRNLKVRFACTDEEDDNSTFTIEVLDS